MENSQVFERHETMETRVQDKVVVFSSFVNNLIARYQTDQFNSAIKPVKAFFLNPDCDLEGAGWLLVWNVVASNQFNLDRQLLCLVLDTENNTLDPKFAEKLVMLDGIAQADETGFLIPPEIVTQNREIMTWWVNCHFRFLDGPAFKAALAQIESWSEGEKQGITEHLKRVKRRIGAARGASKRALSLEERIGAQRKVKALEGELSTNRRQIFAREDEIDTQAAAKASEVEGAFKRTVEVNLLLTVQWQMVNLPFLS